MNVESFKVPFGICISCGYRCNQAGLVTTHTGEHHNPKEGDLTMCGKCGELMQFDKDLSLKLPILDILGQLTPEQHRQIEWLQNYIRTKRPLGEQINTGKDDREAAESVIKKLKEQHGTTQS